MKGGKKRKREKMKTATSAHAMVAFGFSSSSSTPLVKKKKRKKNERGILTLWKQARFSIGVVSRLDGWVVKDYASSRDMETKTPAEARLARF